MKAAEELDIPAVGTVKKVKGDVDEIVEADGEQDGDTVVKVRKTVDGIVGGEDAEEEAVEEEVVEYEEEEEVKPPSKFSCAAKN